MQVPRWLQAGTWSVPGGDGRGRGAGWRSGLKGRWGAQEQEREAREERRKQEERELAAQVCVR
eukprot:2087945-Rhodomonas_salina.1